MMRSLLAYSIALLSAACLASAQTVVMARGQALIVSIPILRLMGTGTGEHDIRF